jgi:hypothetical protein
MASFKIFVKVVNDADHAWVISANLPALSPDLRLRGATGHQIFVPELTVLTTSGSCSQASAVSIVYNKRDARALQTNNVIPKIVENLYAVVSELADSQAIVTPEVAPVPAGETVRAGRESRSGSINWR